MAITYNNYDNTLTFELFNDGVKITDLSILTDVIIELDGTHTVSKSVSPSLFDLTTDKIIVKLGLANIPANTYKARLITKDPANPNGIVWDDNILIVIKN